MGRNRLNLTEEERLLRSKNYRKQYYLDNKEKFNVLHKSSKDDKELYKTLMLYSAKARAKTYGVPFNISVEDFEIPQFCPALGIELITSNSHDSKDSSPSLDRFYPDKGYVKGNVFVISFRANRIKNDSSIEELELILKFLKENKPQRIKDYIII